ncbi:mucin-2 isoform X2 [Clupea harengus]|uniref:Mucin-2 isoform X2 n=1 Tax=Clupea harengus TaxID=7950 RepID=A0A6P8FQU7_CLUHA|nr:mucin-2 isoform X2 [Clupea harengus]
MAQTMIWVLLSVGLCIRHVFAASTLTSSLDMSTTMATPAVTTTKPRISTVTKVSTTSVVSDATTATKTNTAAETNRTLTAEKVDLTEVTTADSLLEKTNISKTTLGLTTNSKTFRVVIPKTNAYVLAATATPKPPKQPLATASSTLITSAEESNAIQSTGSSPTTAEQNRGPQLTPSPSLLGIEGTQGHLGATASSQTASPGPGLDSTLFEQRTEIDGSVNYTASSEAGLPQSLSSPHSSMSPRGNSTQARPDNTERQEREIRTNSVTTANARMYDAYADTTSSAHLKQPTDRVTHTTTNLRTIFTTFRTGAATADPSSALRTSKDMETDTSNISLPVNSTSSLNISIQSHTLATTTQMMTGGVRQTGTGDCHPLPSFPSSPFCTKLTCFLMLWVLATLASFFLGLNIFLWVRLSAVRKSRSWEMEGLTGARGVERGTVEEKDSLWANPGVTVEESAEFWYANGTVIPSSDRHRGTGKERKKEKRREKKGERMNGSLWPQPEVTMADITEFWYGRERPMGRNHLTILEEEEARCVD